MDDADAREALIELAFEPTRRYALRRATPADAEEALSETMLRLWTDHARVPRGSEIAWSIGMCRKILSTMRRTERRRQEILERYAAELIVPLPRPVATTDPQLAEALAALAERDREALLLSVWDGLPPREIAMVLGVTPNAASIRVHRAKQRLRTLLGVER